MPLAAGVVAPAARAPPAPSPAPAAVTVPQVLPQPGNPVLLSAQQPANGNGLGLAGILPEARPVNATLSGQAPAAMMSHVAPAAAAAAAAAAAPAPQPPAAPEHPLRPPAAANGVQPRGVVPMPWPGPAPPPRPLPGNGALPGKAVPLLRPASAPSGVGQQAPPVVLGQLGMLMGRPPSQGPSPAIPAPTPAPLLTGPLPMPAPLAGTKRKAVVALGQPMAPLPLASAPVVGVPMLPPPTAVAGPTAPVLGQPANGVGGAAVPLSLFRPAASAPLAAADGSGWAEPGSSSEGEAAAGLRSLEAAAAASSEAASQRKSRLVWTQELHNRFINALSHLVRGCG